MPWYFKVGDIIHNIERGYHGLETWSDVEVEAKGLRKPAGNKAACRHF